jgi:hypothetical protein
MKNLLFIATMMVASLLFIASGASAQYCSTFLPSCHWQEAAGVKELKATTSGEQQEAEELIPAVGVTEEGVEEMTAAGAGQTTGRMDINENSARFTKGREVCGYCSVFERGGFP